MCVCCTVCQPGALRAVRSALLTQVRCEVLARFSKCLHLDNFRQQWSGPQWASPKALQLPLHLFCIGKGYET